MPASRPLTKMLYRRLCRWICTRVIDGGEQPGYRKGTGPYSMGGNTTLTIAYQKATSHSLRPVAIQQLLVSTQAHGDAEWMLGDCEINHVGHCPRYAVAIICSRANQVTAVAHVLSVQVNPTNNIFELEDGTGRIEARHWVDASAEGDEGKTNGVTCVFFLRLIRIFSLIGCLGITFMRKSQERSSSSGPRNISMSHIFSRSRTHTKLFSTFSK